METKIDLKATNQNSDQFGDQPNDQKSVDKYVGGRLRLRRKLLGKFQSDLGRAIGLKIQQIQKYGKGASRIGAGRLWQLARTLTVPVSYFFDGLDNMFLAIEMPLSQKEFQLCRDLRTMSEPRQTCLFDLVKTFASENSSSQRSRVHRSE